SGCRSRRMRRMWCRWRSSSFGGSNRRRGGSIIPCSTRRGGRRRSICCAGRSGGGGGRGGAPGGGVGGGRGVFAPAGGALVEGALRSLPGEQREVLVLRIWGGLTFAEIATALDQSINTVASRHRYALDALRRQLKPYAHERF